MRPSYTRFHTRGCCVLRIGYQPAGTPPRLKLYSGGTPHFEELLPCEWATLDAYSNLVNAHDPQPHAVLPNLRTKLKCHRRSSGGPLAILFIWHIALADRKNHAQSSLAKALGNAGRPKG